MLKIYNSLTRRKEVFTPIEPGKVGMYVCGVTVYDFSHIGHARMFFVFDMVLRHLRELGYDVTYVRNITDIDDKIIRRAAENAEPVEALTERFIDAFHEDCDTLGLLPPTHEPRATGHIDEIVTMIAQLIENGLAYAADNGDVYYRVNAFEGYGKLSGRQLADLRSGARVEVDEAKEDPLDFVLWKAAKRGEPAWESPWGSGRPGWHIECSAMSTAMLGNTFDIHGGGMDLKFPHHENEIAQSCGATGEDFVKMWIHNGFVEVNAEKMSKSLGNFFTIREVLERYYADEIRYFMLTSQYRSPLNYSDQDLDAARAGLTRLYTALRGLEPGELPASEPYSERFRVAMNDDFNTPEAVAVLFDIAREINRLKGGGDTAAAASLGALLVELGGKLAVLDHPAEQWLKRPQLGADAGEGLSDADIAALVEQRTEARVSKDWALSDKIRDQLAAQGVVLEDGAGTTTWRRGN